VHKKNIILKIKKVWKTLNKIEPKENGSYFHTLKENKQAKIRKDLLDAFGYNYYGSLENKDISELEKVLVNLIIKRIDGLTCPREMMMRMMPPPPSTGLKNKAILDMEKEIDVLIKLRKSKKISSREASKVLTRIQNNAYMICILNVFGNFGFRSN